MKRTQPAQVLGGCQSFSKLLHITFQLFDDRRQNIAVVGQLPLKLSHTTTQTYRVVELSERL